MARVAATNRVTQGTMPFALSFSGAQRIALTTMGALGSSLVGAASFGAWIKTSSAITTQQYIFGCSNSSGGNFAFFGMTRTSARIGKINVQLRDASGRNLAVEVLGQPVNTGDWVHAVFTKDATNVPGGMKIYLNGVSQTLTTVTSAGYADPVDFNRAMAIGSSLGSAAVASAWVGSIATPHFFLRELTATEVSNWHLKRTIPSSPFAGYLCTEGAGTAVADVIGAHNGTLTSAGQWTADAPYKARVTRSL